MVVSNTVELIAGIDNRAEQCCNNAGVGDLVCGLRQSADTHFDTAEANLKPQKGFADNVRPVMHALYRNITEQTVAFFDRQIEHAKQSQPSLN